jgi:hypothetical protein
MNRTELLDGLYQTRSELLRLIIGSAREHIDPDKLHGLIQQREAITWVINAVIDSEALAAVGNIDEQCKKIAEANDELRRLIKVVDHVDKAIEYSKQVLDVATAIVVAAL